MIETAREYPTMLDIHVFVRVKMATLFLKNRANSSKMTAITVLKRLLWHKLRTCSSFPLFCLSRHSHLVEPAFFVFLCVTCIPNTSQWSIWKRQRPAARKNFRFLASYPGIVCSNGIAYFVTVCRPRPRRWTVDEAGHAHDDIPLPLLLKGEMK